MCGESAREQNERDDDETDDGADKKAQGQRELIFPAAKILDEVQQSRESRWLRARGVAL